MNFPAKDNEHKVPESRVRLTKLELNVASLPDIPHKRILNDEIARAKETLQVGDSTYADLLWSQIRRTASRIKWYYRLVPNRFESNITLWLKGIVLYSILVLGVFGPCAVIVAKWPGIINGGKGVTNGTCAMGGIHWLVELVCYFKLAPLFETVIGLKIQPEGYLWGLLGGAGAVVSMVKRIDSIANQVSHHWLVFTQGLFNPIVGSLSAVITCRFYETTMKGAGGSMLPLVVLAFFAGFSERILSNLADRVKDTGKSQT